MKIELVPPPERVVAELLPVLRVLYAAIEAGIFRTVEFFADEEAAIDANLAPNLVRYHAKQYLDDANSPLIDDVEIERQELGNNGLLIKYGPHLLRVLKSDNGRVPVPGASQLKRDYYQQPLPFIAMADPEAKVPPLKLIVLWDATPLTYAFQGIDLALPMSGGEDRASVRCHWQQQVDVPLIAGTEADATATEPAGIEDLPITLKPMTKTGTSNGDGEAQE